MKYTKELKRIIKVSKKLNKLHNKQIKELKKGGY